MYFHYFDNYLPLEKGGALHFNKFESFSPKDMMFCAKFGWNWSSGCREEHENVKKMYHNQDSINNDDGQQTNFDQNSSLEPLWAKKDIGNITETVLLNEEVNTMNKKKSYFSPLGKYYAMHLPENTGIGEGEKAVSISLLLSSWLDRRRALLQPSRACPLREST